MSARSVYKLFIGNLSWTISNHELKYYFSKFGHISNVTVVFDKESKMSKGYGFVTFSTRDGYNSAANKNNHFLEGRVLSVQPANS